MALAFIGLGSNLGDRETNIGQAITHLTAVADVRLKAKSSLYESPALLKEGAPDEWNRPYLNAVVALDTGLLPHTLLAVLQEVEKAIGRQDRGRWAPREIDCDLLAYDDHVLITQTLTLPHEGMLTRDFVLLPWCEIAPDWHYPVPGKDYGLPIRKLCERLTSPTARKVTEPASHD